MNTFSFDTVVLYGDSISAEEDYTQLMQKALGARFVFNHAVGSSGLSSHTPDNLIGILKKKEALHPQADLIVLWHGTNDWYWGAPLGAPKDTCPETYCGALRQAVAALRCISPRANIVSMTPLPRWQEPDGIPASPAPRDGYFVRNRAGHTLAEYEAALLSCSRELCFPVIDLRTLMNLHPGNASLYLKDGIHPNRRGYEVLTRIASAQIRLWYEIKRAFGRPVSRSPKAPAFSLNAQPKQLLRDVRHQRQMTRPLDGNGQRSLVLRAVAGDPSGKDLASLGYVSFQLVHVLVIDDVIFSAKYADFLSSAHAASSLCRSIRSVGFIECHIGLPPV